MRTWLRAAGVGSAGKRRGITWREFIRAHRRSLLAVDFFTVETIWLQRLDVLFFIELGRRRVHLGCPRNPKAPWVTRKARKLFWTFAERSEPLRFLIRDRDDAGPPFLRTLDLKRFSISSRARFNHERDRATERVFTYVHCSGREPRFT